jgi:hypothetical protein
MKEDQLKNDEFRFPLGFTPPFDWKFAQAVAYCNIFFDLHAILRKGAFIIVYFLAGGGKSVGTYTSSSKVPCDC